MPSTSPFDHLRPVDDDFASGIYRVVGTDPNAVTMLRVADADGRRVSTGELLRVSEDDLAGFEPAANPDGNRPLGAALAAAVETGYWTVRVFGRQLLAHPLPSAGAGSLVLAGLFGDRFLALPAAAVGLLALAGSLGLAYVGGGRLA